MALTLDVDQKLDNVGLIDYFRQHKKEWLDQAKRSIAYLKGSLPAGSIIRRDDVAKALFPIVEVDEDLQAFLSGNHLTQKYWFRYFVDLIIDRCWDDISKK